MHGLRIRLISMVLVIFCYGSASAQEPTFVTGINARDEIQFYDAEGRRLSTMKTRAFENQFAALPEGSGPGGKGLPIVSINKVLGLIQLAVNIDNQPTDVWVTRSSVEVWPTPDVCQNSVRGAATVSEPRVTVGIGGCAE